MSEGTDGERSGSRRIVSDDPARLESEARISDSDRRVRHADPVVRAELRRRRRRINRVYLAIGAGVVAVLVGYLALYFLPVLSVRSVEVTGATSVTPDDVRTRAQVPTGTPLLQVDTHEIAKRVAGIPHVSEVTVTRSYPSTLRIAVVERQAAVVVDVGGVPHLVDHEGVDFGRGEAPPGTPVLTLSDRMRPTLPQTVRDLAPVLAEFRDTIGLPVSAVEVTSPSGVTVTVADGRKVEWGEPGRDREKALALRAVLDRPGAVWNVSNPTMPTSR